MLYLLIAQHFNSSFHLVFYRPATSSEHFVQSPKPLLWVWSLLIQMNKLEKPNWDAWSRAGIASSLPSCIRRLRSRRVRRPTGEPAAGQRNFQIGAWVLCSSEQARKNKSIYCFCFVLLNWWQHSGFLCWVRHREAVWCWSWEQQSVSLWEGNSAFLPHIALHHALSRAELSGWVQEVSHIHHLKWFYIRSTDAIVTL